MLQPGQLPGMDTAAGFISDRVKRGDYYFLDLDPEPGSVLSVVCGGREVCDGSYLVDRKDFRYYSLEFVASGSGTVSLANQEYGTVNRKPGLRDFALEPGTVFCYGPGIPHRINAGPATAMVKYFVDFTGRESEGLVRAVFPDGTPWAVSSADWIQRLFEDLKTAADNLTETRAAVCALIVRQLLVMLADRTLSGAPGELDRRARFRNLKSRLRELALQGFDLQHAAAACGISPSYLSRLFRRFDTETPQRWMTRCRMTFAASLLLDHRLLIKEVATMAGYDDQYHFSRIFKTIYGHSPDAFRRFRQ
jgi:AraC-like DNA-binding protein